MTYRAGIIGAGGIAGLGILGMHDPEEIGKKKVRTSHAGGYHASDDVELVAVADLNEETLTTFGEAWDVPPSGRYTSHERMLDEEELDVVSVCTPTLFHHDHVIDAAEIGDPDVIWCEKPIATSVADGRHMCETCDREGIELVVNHSFRFTDKLVTLKSLLDEDELIGDPRSASVQFRMELMRNSTHVIDSLVYLFDMQPQLVSGYISGENEVSEALDVGVEITDAGGGGYVVAEDGFYVNIDCTLPRNVSSMTYNVIGDRGKLYLNNDDGEWRYWRLEDGDHVETPLPGIDGAWTWEDDYTESFVNAASHLVDLLDGEVTNRSPGEEAVSSLAVIVGLYVSHYTDGRVRFPLETPLEDVTVTSW